MVVLWSRNSCLGLSEIASFILPECLATFTRMFEDIPRNVWRNSSEYNIPPIPHVPCIPFPVPAFLVLNTGTRNRMWGTQGMGKMLYSGECHQTFRGMLPSIPENVLKYSADNIPPISRVPGIPFFVPVFLVLYIANQQASFINRNDETFSLTIYLFI